jgi:hypothetical protein
MSERPEDETPLPPPPPDDEDALKDLEDPEPGGPEEADDDPEDAGA